MQHRAAAGGSARSGIPTGPRSLRGCWLITLLEASWVTIQQEALRAQSYVLSLQCLMSTLLTPLPGLISLFYP